ncbi:MAG: caspase family protein [Campylobacterota bacterium]|nr:caspase family protein [Campylobacterota bacterium]
MICTIQVDARERVALVIGNADYLVKPLNNPVNDAEDIARALKELDFDVSLITNADQETMESAIQNFGQKLNENSVGLFYYSGHGIQHEGSNYLIPIAAMKNVQVAKHLRYKAVNAGYVLSEMHQSGLNIVILDACRSNPFKSFSRSAERGLAKISGLEGTLIAYSTAPGKVALDGIGRNSPYTKHLISLMKKPNVPIELMLKEVRTEVKSETNNKQSPWYEVSIDGEFIFSKKNISNHDSFNKKKISCHGTDNDPVECLFQK